jgi:hypothetical protein
MSSVRTFMSRIDKRLVGTHTWILLPLVATQLLQRMEHVIDNRFISALGSGALLIHSINYNFFQVAQAVGLAASTSALIFWKRAECADRQKSILTRHVIVTALAGLCIAGACFPFLRAIATQYGVSAENLPAATRYLGVGLLNLILAAVYTPLNALLIASDQRVKSLVNVGMLLVVKMAAGFIALHVAASHQGLTHPMIVIGAGGSLAIASLSAIAWWHVRLRAHGDLSFGFAQMRSVWGHEMGTAAIRSTSPFLYTFFLAKSVSGSSLMVTYQLTLHLAYILCLPQTSGGQLAMRDASAEQSLPEEKRPQGLLDADWFRWFFAVSILPTQVLLFLGAAFAPFLMRVFYAYALPREHMAFVSIYFLACAVGQWGNIYLIELRALRKNATAMRNFLVAEIGVMVGLTGLAVWAGWGTPLVLGLVVMAYCGTYLALNLAATRLPTAAPQRVAVTS